MKSAYSIFKEIENTSGKNDKIAIIKANSDNSHFTEYLKFLYDDMIVTGLSSKKIGKQVDKSFDTYFEDDIEVMNYLRNNNTGKDTDIANVQNFIDSYGRAEYADFLREVFTKSYKCGITSSSVNKALGRGFIKVFDIQASKGWEKHGKKMLGKEFVITQKMDGVRCLVIKRDGEITCYSRSGHVYEDMIEIACDYALPMFPDGVYDGEALAVDDGTGSTLGLFQKTKSIISRNGIKTGLRHCLFDYISLDMFDNQDKSPQYTKRRDFIEELHRRYSEMTSHMSIQLLPVLYKGKDLEQVKVWYDFGKDKGWEGIMINLSSAIYQFKRSDKILKYKYEDSADLLCVGVFEATGEDVGTLGGVELEYKNGSIVRSGSGFDDKQKMEYWNDPSKVIGKIIQVKHYGETVDEKTKLKSLRHPIFITIRNDKTVKDVRYTDKE